MIRGLHHAGISVRDLDRSIEFYRKLGLEVVQQVAFGGDAMDRITRLTGTRGRAAMLRADALYLELFEFEAPQPRQVPRAVCDHGISHFCIEVTDVHAAFERLKSMGVEFHCEPQVFGSAVATYARDPDGNVIELLQVG